MKPLGIVRKMDGLGRVVLPPEARVALGLKEGDPVEFFSTTTGVFLRKYDPGAGVPTDNKIDAVEM